jgi:nucleoside 2-deoxyribosyltransferase
MRVFLAAPLTQTLGPERRVDPTFRADLSRLHEFLEDLGHEVFSAHVRERWGEALDTPSGALAIDLAQLNGCDVVVAVLGTPPSPGVQLELGYAVACDKPILIIASDAAEVPYLVMGLPDFTDASVHRSATIDEARGFLDKELRRLDPAPRADGRGRHRSGGRLKRIRRGGP